MRTPGIRSERGMILAVVMVAILVLSVLAAGFLMTSVAQSDRAQVSEEDVQLLNIAEAGVAAAIQDLVASGTGDVTGDFGGGSFTVVTTDQGGGYFNIASSATFDQTNRQWTKSIEVVVLETNAATTLDVRAAIEANNDVTTGGNFIVDGRDFDYLTGSLTGDPGVYGISTTGTVTQTGSSQIGGNGQAPAGDEVQTEQNITWGDSLDNDGDAAVDEEIWDGKDNDGDGLEDEDTDGYATDPNVRVGLPSGTLEAAAQAAGTYFTSGAQYDAWIAANGGKAVPGSIVFVMLADNATWNGVNLGNTALGDDPSILVVDSPNHSATMKNIHDDWIGLIIACNIDHTNGTADIYGAMLCLSGQLGNAFGNGTAYVHYSSNALGNLPAAQSGGYQRISWKQE